MMVFERNFESVTESETPTNPQQYNIIKKQQQDMRSQGEILGINIAVVRYKLLYTPSY